MCLYINISSFLFFCKSFRLYHTFHMISLTLRVINAPAFTATLLLFFLSFVRSLIRILFTLIVFCCEKPYIIDPSAKCILDSKKIHQFNTVHVFIARWNNFWNYTKHRKESYTQFFCFKFKFQRWERESNYTHFVSVLWFCSHFLLMYGVFLPFCCCVVWHYNIMNNYYIFACKMHLLRAGISYMYIFNC